MTKREAEMVRKLVQCYREHRDDRLLDILELLTDERPAYMIPPLHFFDAEGKCIASTERMSCTLAAVSVNSSGTEDSTHFQMEGSALDSSGVIQYCNGEDGKKTDEKG